MKNLLWICVLLIFKISYSQTDTLTLKKEGRFKVAGQILKDNVLSVPRDFVEMGHTFSENWKRTAIYTGGLVGLIALDKQTTGYFHDKIEPNVDYSLPNITFIKNDLHWLSGNNAYITYPLIGLYAGSFVANNSKGQIAATNALKSMGYCFIISHVLLKTGFARNRPQRRINDDIPAKDPWTKDNWDFFNFHPVYLGTSPGGTGFPSTHATAYYAVAKVIQMEYDNYWIPYTFATAVFLADIKTHNHWVSDLVGGALVGTIVGRSVVKSSRKRREKTNELQNKYSLKGLSMEKQWIPQWSSSMIGLQFVGTF